MFTDAFCIVFFFFKQKTAYEIKECDWSSDVCSSDLYLTVVLCIFQAYGFAIFTEQLTNAVAHPGWGFRMTTVLTLTTGGIFVMWLGEQITERGIGNGMSLLIFFSIIDPILPETLAA